MAEALNIEKPYTGLCITISIKSEFNRSPKEQLRGRRSRLPLCLFTDSLCFNKFTISHMSSFKTLLNCNDRALRS